MSPIQQALMKLSQGAYDTVSNPQRAIGQYVQDSYIKDPQSGQMFPQGLISAKTPKDLVMKGVMGLSTPVNMKKVHPDDMKVMEQLIDSVRLKKPNPSIELDASRVAEHYGMPMPKTTSGLANSFDNLLQTYMQAMKKR